MPTLHALDLTDRTDTDRLWRPRPGSPPPRLEGHPELPPDGFASPLGFWFAPAASWAASIPPLRVDILDAGELDGGAPTGGGRSSPDATVDRPDRARIDLPAGRDQPAGSATPLIVEIDPSIARIGVAPESWPSVAGPVLLVVAQFWRLRAIERALEQHTDGARGFLGGSLPAGPTRWRRGSRALRARHRALQALILDLPDFEGPLTNPRGYLAPGRPVRLYRTLAARLGLDRRRSAIDERVEAVEAVLDALAEVLNHRQALTSQIVLELIIVALLLADVGLYFLDAVLP